ncbi:two-component system activity regulator YycH [Fructilactobacillus hinvesii]|uniref:Two-component system activity regulator YycH n=1 Tax=Fructilactobacillus hinvesii TaxID=2940300 RepID=A0ABY5BWL5_9LACO|nr:two-component system activity regulator YycH [Fructilactobacillus hinvesii]USS88129.1 two-component system activity regulator YycH [Fructilactobacillus hinvesii]
MMEKLKRYLLPLSLTLAVLISVVLSVSLLTNPARFSSKTHQNRSVALHNDMNSRPFQDVYSPLRVVKTDDHEHQRMLTSPTTNIVAALVKQLRGSEMSNLKRVSNHKKQRYFDLLNQPDSLMLNYNDVLAGPVLGRVLNQAGLFSKQQRFERIVISLHEQGKIYFFNDNHYQVYAANIRDLNLKQLQRTITHDVVSNRVEIRALNNKPFLYFPHEIKLKDYGYMLQEQSQSTYLSRIIGNSTDTTVKHHQGDTIYSSANQDLTFTANDDVIYNNFRPQKSVKTEADALQVAYHNAVQLGVPLASSQFDTYQNKDKTVVYRSFIDGFPIFGNEQLGNYSYQFVNGTTERYQFSLRDFQIPVPTEEQQTTLPSSKELLSQLMNANVDIKRISNVQLGYQIVPNDDHKLLILLRPSWFVKYDNQWINYLDLEQGNFEKVRKENF